MLKPDALERELAQDIMERFIEARFTIEIVGYKKTTEELILAHYEEPMRRIEGLKEMALKNLTDKYMMPMIVAYDGKDAITRVSEIVGKTNPPDADVGTIRHDFGEDSLERSSKENRFLNNLIHRCDNKEAFNREVKLWLGEKTYMKYRY